MIRDDSVEKSFAREKIKSSSLVVNIELLQVVSMIIIHFGFVET